MSITSADDHEPVEQYKKIKSDSQQKLIKSELDMPVWQQRHRKVSSFVQNNKIKSVLDLGCAQGTLINRLSRSCVDCNQHVLELAKYVIILEIQNVAPQLLQDDIAFHRESPLQVSLYKLNVLEQLPYQLFHNIQLITMIQFIEHFKQEDLPILCTQVFKNLSPNYIMITTPNQQFNIYFNMKAGQMRHSQHLFQWDRNKFNTFCQKLSQQYGYDYLIFGVGQHVSSLKYGYCSQGAFFVKKQKNKKIVPHSNKNSIEPFFYIKYPFWKDKVNRLIQNQIRDQIIRNNFEPPNTITQRFKNSKIGLKILQYKKEMNKQQQIQEQIKQLPLIDNEWIIKQAKKIKYCGYNEEQNYLFYEYQDSRTEEADDMFDEQNYLNEIRKIYH